jgi:BirA family biotin operon repressor/biotin-[acetyl-CoA-carboxylase] ligase
MTSLDADAIRGALGEFASQRLEEFEAFAEIESTNSYLLRQPAPSPGRVRVALTENQTAGRGRHGRTWQSPPGSGLCLSMGYTFARQPANLPALTLAIGFGVTEALSEVGITGVLLKWPNDLMANDGKLGGILTETLPLADDAIAVVTGIGINFDLGGRAEPAVAADARRPVADLAGYASVLPSRHALAAGIIDSLCRVFADYESSGFAGLASRWSGCDWLRDRQLVVDTPHRQVTGIGAGVAEDGALLVDTGTGILTRITSGSIVAADAGEGHR